MKLKIVYIIVSFILLCSQVTLAQVKENIISVNMKPNNRLILNRTDGMRSISALEFVNSQSIAKRVEKKFISAIPTHLFYSNVLVKKDGTEKRVSGSILVLPGDTTHLDLQPENFLDTFIEITPAVYVLGNKFLIEPLKKTGLSIVLDSIDQRYTANVKSIQSSKKDDKIKLGLLNFNYVLKSAELANVPFELLKEEDLKRMDSLHSDILKNMDRIYSINSLLNFRIYYYLIRYSAFRNGNKEPNFWNFFDQSSNEVKQSIFYKPYLFTQMDFANKSNPDNLSMIVAKLKKTKIDQSLIDSYYDKLMSFDGLSKFDSLSDRELSVVMLTNTLGRSISLKDVLAGHKGKVIMIDFWASWCVPCRSEFPKYEELKSKYVNESISFINISIDLDSAIPAWKKALAEEKIKDPQNHYRLINPKASLLTEKIGLRSIPRYVIIDSTGNIIDGDAIRPSNPEIFSRLNTIIKNYKAN